MEALSPVAARLGNVRRWVARISPRVYVRCKETEGGRRDGGTVAQEGFRGSGREGKKEGGGESARAMIASGSADAHTHSQGPVHMRNTMAHCTSCPSLQCEQPGEECGEC